MGDGQYFSLWSQKEEAALLPLLKDVQVGKHNLGTWWAQKSLLERRSSLPWAFLGRSSGLRGVVK